MKAETLARLRAARGERRPVARVAALDGSVDAVVEEGGGPLPEAVLEVARAALRQNRSHDFEHEDGRWFVQVFNPPLRLIVVGAVHISQPLILIAEQSRLRRHAGRSAGRLCDGGAVSRCRDLRRVARRCAGGARRGRTHGRGDAHP